MHKYPGMPRKKKVNLSDIVAASVVKGMKERKAKKIVILDMQKVNSPICDKFIICHGTSKIHVEAIADSIQQEVKKATGENAWHAEGFENAEWVLIDFVDVVAHIFQESARNFYGLEKLWADAITSEEDTDE